MPALSPIGTSVPHLPGFSADVVRDGKVRETYPLGRYAMLVRATDRISVFDIVLNALVPEKGMILTAMTHFWMKKLEEQGIPTHFLEAGAGIDQWIPEPLRGDVDTQSRSMVVKRLNMSDGEFIFRTHFLSSSSSFKSYDPEKGGEICGHTLPAGLQDGDELPMLLDTPTTKAIEGNDMPLDAAATREKYPEETALVGRAFKIVSDYARSRGILMPDTKGEAGRDDKGVVTLGDEFGTPDSSRFWDLAEWKNLRNGDKRKSPPPFDKQLVREWAIGVGINKLDPKNPEHIARAHSLEVPQELIERTTQTYRYIFWRLTGQTIEDYMQEHLGVVLPWKKRQVDVVFGSESDIKAVAGEFNPEGNDLRVHVLSCHRNPDDLRKYVAEKLSGVDTIVAAGGLAFALPGVLDAHIHAAGGKTRVIGVALGSNPLSAQLSISDLPGKPVVMNELDGVVYTGKSGFKAALERALYGELPPAKSRVERSAMFNLDPSVLR